MSEALTAYMIGTIQHETALRPFNHLGVLDAEPTDAEDGSVYVNEEFMEMFMRVDGRWIMMAGSEPEPIKITNCRNCGAGLRTNVCDYCKTNYS